MEKKSNKNEFIVDSADVGMRIDNYLTVKLNNFTRSKVQSICENNKVFVNDKAVSKNYRVFANDLIKVDLPTAEDTNIELIPQDIPIEVFYTDEYLSVVNKPKGMAVYPTAHHKQDTLVNALVYKFGKKLSLIGGSDRPGIVHRIDKDTSGLIVIAHDDVTHEKLSAMIRNHKINREYQGVVYGKPQVENGLVESPIGRDPHHRTRMAIVDNGREAKTEYTVIEHYPHFTHMKFKLYTGRTHQIRVHMASIGNPLAGDTVYGPAKAITELKGQCLHAFKLDFMHPITNLPVVIISELPAYFQSFIRKIDR